MKKQSLIILFIAISLLFAACSPVITANPGTSTNNTSVTTNPPTSSSPTQASDPPPTTSTPTQPTEPPVTKPDPNALTADEIAELQNIYQLVKSETGRHVTNFYNAALGMEYSDPKDISLSYFFCQGDGEEFETTRMTEEEYEFIKSVIPDAEHFDLCRISAEDVERILQMCFGLSLSDMNEGLGSLHYWDKTDCYYSIASYPPTADNLVITGGTHLEDGNLMVSYTSQEGNWGELKQFVMMLKPVDGGYHILFNQRLKT